MKILFVEPCPLYFGGYYRSFEICRALSNSGVKVDLLVSTNHDHNLKIEKKRINKNFNIYVLPRFKINFYINGRITRGIIATAFGLLKKYDIIHVTAPIQAESNIPAAILKLLGKKIVYSWDDIWTGADGYQGWITIYLNFWENFSPKFFQNVVAISHIIKNRAIKLGAKNTIKIINGTDKKYPVYDKAASRKKLGFDPNDKLLFTFGNTFSQERVYLILKTFQQILHTDKSVKLISNTDLKKILTGHPHQYRILDHTYQSIINTGYIEEKLLPYYLSSVDAVLLPLSKITNDRACYPVRMSKIISSESIVLTLENHSETSSILKKYKCAIVEANTKKLAQKTIYYLSNQKYQSYLKNNVKLAKQDLTWNKLAHKLVSFYRRIHPSVSRS